MGAAGHAVFRVRISWDDVVVNQEAANFVEVLHGDDAIPVDKSAKETILEFEEGVWDWVTVLAGVRDRDSGNVEAVLSPQIRVVDCYHERPTAFPPKLTKVADASSWLVLLPVANSLCASEIGLIYGPEEGGPKVRPTFVSVHLHIPISFIGTR